MINSLETLIPTNLKRREEKNMPEVSFFGYWSCVTFASSVLKEWTAAVGILKYMWVLNHDSASKINRNRKHQHDLQCKFSTEALRGSENLIFALQKSIRGKRVRNKKCTLRNKSKWRPPLPRLCCFFLLNWQFSAQSPQSPHLIWSRLKINVVNWTC